MHDQLRQRKTEDRRMTGHMAYATCIYRAIGEECVLT
jgi:hypothetical protein